jgi:hypothetical protein
MAYRITGIDPSGPVTFFRDELEDAAYWASKMFDQGVRDVHLFDEAGNEIDVAGALFPKGFERDPFKDLFKKA